MSSGTTREHHSNTDISGGLVAGIVLIAVVLVATLITLLVVVCLKMRNRQLQDIEARSFSATNFPMRANRLQLPINDVPNATGPPDLLPSHPAPIFRITTNAYSDHTNDNPSYDASCTKDSLSSEDPHYVSPRSPINQGNSWSEDPHYASPRSPMCNKKNDWKEDPHYVSPRSPISNRCRLGEEDANYANLPLKSNELKKESDYDNPPIPRLVQDIGGTFSEASVDQSQYDTVGKPRPLTASGSISGSTNTTGKSSRKFKSPFAAVDGSNTSEETEPIYANT